MAKTAGIVVIGNEILSGKVVDTNSPYICQELRTLGVDVRRIVVVPDEIEVIAMSRPAFAAALLAAALLLAPLSAQQQQTPAPAEKFEEMTKAQAESYRRGIDWLVKSQNADGLWGCEKSGAPSTAITGLTVLAFLASGSTPSMGEHALRIRRAIDKLISIQTPSGQITRFDSTGMGIFYDHSCATLALAEVYGMRKGGEHMDDVRTALE